MVRTKFSYLWILETKLGTWKDWVTKGKKGPQLNENGCLTLGKKQYPVDAKKFRKWTIKNKFGDIKHTMYVQIWKEDEPTPLDFFDSEKKVGDDITGTILQRLSRIKRLDLITSDTEMDWKMIILLMSVVGNFAAIAGLIWLVLA